MTSRFSVLATLISMVNVNSAYAWYGPLCYSDSVRQVTLTQPTIAGETAGDLKVTFDDNQNHVKLATVRASLTVKGAHEVVLTRDKSSSTGIFGVLLTSPRATVGYKYELEFRKDPAECAGMIIKTSADTKDAAPAMGPRPVRAKPPRKPKPVKEAEAPVSAAPAPAAAESSDGAEAGAAPTGGSGMSGGVPEEAPKSRPRPLDLKQEID